MSHRKEQIEALNRVITDAVADYRDGRLPASVAVDGTVLAILNILDGDEEHPGYVLVPKNNHTDVILDVVRADDYDAVNTDKDLNLAGSLTSLFKGINT